MSQFTNWFAMGGYAVYVWPAYGLALAVLVYNVASIKKQKQNTLRKLRQWFEG